MKPIRWVFFVKIGLLLPLVALFGCAATYKAYESNETIEIGKDARYVVVVPGEQDTLRSLAQRYLGDPNKYWIIAEFNGTQKLTVGQAVVIPLQSQNPIGVYADGYQTVPVLCYHRFGETNGQMTVSPIAFREQLTFLRDNGYQVIPLHELYAFVQGNHQIPSKSVVITIDDGHRSIYQEAFPILKEFGYPATVFIYSDYINGGGLTWNEIAQMQASGLINFQPHSKTHSNLALLLEGEKEFQYSQRIEAEVNKSKQRLQDRIDSEIFAFAYPYGDTNHDVINELKKHRISIGLTVQSGGNPFFAYPFMLQRTMIFRKHDLATFEESLKTFQAHAL